MLPGTRAPWREVGATAGVIALMALVVMSVRDENRSLQLLQGRSLQGEDLRLARLVQESKKLGVTGLPSFPPGARRTGLEMDYGNDQLPIPNLEPGSSTPNIPFPSPSNAWQRRRRSLISNMLSMDYGNDELPIPNLEPGSSTPNIPFPPGTGVSDKAGRLQSLAEEGLDNSGAALAKAGVNVGADLSATNGHGDDRYIEAQHVAPSVAFKSHGIKKAQSLYAPAWSPDYLEPYRHPTTDQAAWKWMSSAKKQHEQEVEVEEKEASDAQKSLDKIVGDVWNNKIDRVLLPGSHSSLKNLKQGKPAVSATTKSTNKSGASLPASASAEKKAVSPVHKGAQPGAEASKAETHASPAAKAERTQKLSTSSAPKHVVAAHAKKEISKETVEESQSELEKLRVAEDILKGKTGQETAKKVLKPADTKPDTTTAAIKGDHPISAAEKRSLKQTLFAHGFGTSNRFQAQPLDAAKNQFYGGDHKYFGSDQPVTSREGKVSAREAYANDGKTEVYDLSNPTSFDSIPLASPSAFMSRVAAHEPAGVSAHERIRLDRNLYRGQVLAAWRKYEHGLEQCMEAEATIDPTLKDYSCKDVSTGFTYLRDCMQNHNFGLEDVGGVKLKFVGDEKAWSALPKLIQYTYSLPARDYEQVYNVLRQSAIFGTLWNMERLHVRCAATGSTEAPRASRVAFISSIDRDVRGYDEAMRRAMPGTATQQRGYDIMHNGDKGMGWHYPGVARGVARGYWKIPSSTREAPTSSRASLPYWREVAGDQPGAGGLRRIQPRARLSPDTAGAAAFPRRVNGKQVNPANPRPWQASKGAPDPWTGYYWTGPGKYDIVPESHPITQARTGYNYPTTAKPAAGVLCVEDVECPQMSVCSSTGVCRVWGGGDVWQVPAQQGLWPANSTPDWY